MNGFQLVCFDMDGTLIRNTNSVRLLCTLNGRDKEVNEIEEREAKGEVHWIEADYEKVKLMEALPLAKLQEEFEQRVELIGNINQVIAHMKEKGLKVILVTAGPLHVAECLKKKYDFDEIFGSEYEVENGIFSGRIIKHLGEHGKLESLLNYCKNHDIPLQRCIAVGDGDSDIEIFKHTGKAIAINYSQTLSGKAHQYLMTEDLKDILIHI
ncbi:phosphoserine phosphatase [Anaerosolibacter carboniphilus]|uniref:phosphoserine phosphatase n=1 Tax=Anaerosolibacter carboniphilus TaxID=1417629 RepID=A0A841KY10_9FIRM|nr:HAD family phosphatase [Anaerosolibacter carboniphilus]MBB6216880.1 phosphoserine phosphatase [Anaerosolibacter carboniphilus]